LKDAERGVLCDSIIQNRQEQIRLLEEKNQIQEDQKQTLLDGLEACKEENENLSEDLDKAIRKNKILKIVSGAAILTAAVEAVILIIVTK